MMWAVEYRKKIILLSKIRRFPAENHARASLHPSFAEGMTPLVHPLRRRMPPSALPLEGVEHSQQVSKEFVVTCNTATTARWIRSWGGADSKVGSASRFAGVGFTKRN